MKGNRVVMQDSTWETRFAETPLEDIGKTITAISLSDEALHLTFEDGSKLKLADDGQSCCEARYMRTDDVLDNYVGAVFNGAEVREAPDMVDPDGYNDTHEVEFLAIQTSKGEFVMSNHNEHNGYYGGFAIYASRE